MQAVINDIYQQESRRILATLIRLLGDFDQAEESMHEAFAIAMQQWPEQGVPDNPAAWLVSTARFKAIDQVRRSKRHSELLANEGHEEAGEVFDPGHLDEELIQDDQLRLIFICCHPRLPTEAQLALTLREVCGITTEEVASAFLMKTSTVAQRIVRAKQRIRDEELPYEVPEPEALPERLQAVLTVIYLLFNEGYSASSGEKVVRHDLAAEAIRLCRLLLSLLPHPEVAGLLALMLLQDARQAARVDDGGDLVRLEDQDRSLWDQGKIEEGRELLTRSLLTRQFGSYTLQAAINAVHSDAPDFAETDWPQIVDLYDALLQLNPSPIVRLNQAVAISMTEGPASGLALVEEILGKKELKDYYLSYATLADFHRQLGNREAAVEAYRQALELTRQEPEQRYLRKRLAELI